MFENFQKVEKARLIHKINSQNGRKPHLITINPITPKLRKKLKPHLRDGAIYSKKNFYNLVKDIPKNVVVKFDERELKKFREKYKKLYEVNYGIIISENTSSGFARVKRWGTGNMQKVVDSTKNKIKWVQVGVNNDDKLQNIFLDMRGKTNLRELFFIVSKSKIIVTTEGMLTHLSSAFNIPCITIYPGFLYPEISNYDNIVSIQPEPLPDCAYCWKAICKINNKRPPCLDLIKSEKVIKKVKLILKDERN